MLSIPLWRPPIQSCQFKSSNIFNMTLHWNPLSMQSQFSAQCKGQVSLLRSRSQAIFRKFQWIAFILENKKIIDIKGCVHWLVITLGQICRCEHLPDRKQKIWSSFLGNIRGESARDRARQKEKSTRVG